MKLNLGTQVAAAVGGMLVGCESITLEDVMQRLPSHLKAANPSIKSVTKALIAAGWAGERHDGGRIVYAPVRADDEGEHDPTHNGFEGGSVAADEVRLLIERRERLEEDRKGIGDDIKDWAAEARGRGYDVKALNAVIKIRSRKKEERQEEEAILEVYMRALGMMA